MSNVNSADGTVIAYDRSGSGPALVLVSPAFGDRAGMAPLAAALAPQFSVLTYDRRGRGDSGDTAPYAVEREIEDLAAVVEAAGGSAFAFGHSSGAALVIEAVLAGLPITKMALYEPPYVIDDSRPPLPDDYVATLRTFAEDNRRGDAVEYFWRVALGMPEQAIAGAKASPMWPFLESMAHTLWYDGAVLRDNVAGKPLPAEWATTITIPTLAIDGAESPPVLRNAVAAVVERLPNATRQTLEGQGHGAAPEVLAPVLATFFLG